MLSLLVLALAQSPCQPSEVAPAAPSSTQRFWEVMAADEDRLMVGQETGSGNLRRLLVFERAPGTGDWVEVQELALGAAQGSSLLDLALDGDRAVASAEGLPEGGLGTFMASQGNQVLSSPLYNGDLCLGGGSIYRNLGGRQFITGEGTARVLLNRPLIPDSTGGLVPVLPGDTWYFQYWFYDPSATPSTGFSDAVGVTFTQF